ncbi:MAG: hypothetical protein EBU66_19185 [Bacteroidetes bacterium]|nr:hypothetical protein [Bacteroidota bacterium]
MPTGSTYGGRRRKYKRTQKLKHKRRKTMRKRLVRLRGGGKDHRLIDAVLTNKTATVISVLADLIIETKGVAGIGQPNDPLVDSEIYRSTSGKTPLFFTIRNKSSGVLGFGGSSSCLPKKEFNKTIYILLRLLGAYKDIEDNDGNTMLASEECQAFANDILEANNEFYDSLNIYGSLSNYDTVEKKIKEIKGKRKGMLYLLIVLIETIRYKDEKRSVDYVTLYNSINSMLNDALDNKRRQDEAVEAADAFYALGDKKRRDEAANDNAANKFIRDTGLRWVKAAPYGVVKLE